MGGTRRADAAAVRTKKDLEQYERIFADAAFWKKLGEEHENPLIITGTIMFTPQEVARYENENRETYDQLGRRVVVPVRTFRERKGFVLEPKFVFIDGRTGATLYSETQRREVLYPLSQSTPALASYFELMDQLIPDFLGARYGMGVDEVVRGLASENVNTPLGRAGQRARAAAGRTVRTAGAAARAARVRLACR